MGTVLASDLTPEEQFDVILLNTFREIPQNEAGHFQGVLDFYFCGDPPRGDEPAPPERLLDWKKDALRIWGDFRVYAEIPPNAQRVFFPVQEPFRRGRLIPTGRIAAKIEVEHPLEVPGFVLRYFTECIEQDDVELFLRRQVRRQHRSHILHPPGPVRRHLSAKDLVRQLQHHRIHSQPPPSAPGSGTAPQPPGVLP